MRRHEIRWRKRRNNSEKEEMLRWKPAEALEEERQKTVTGQWQRGLPHALPSRVLLPQPESCFSNTSPARRQGMLATMESSIDVLCSNMLISLPSTHVCFTGSVPCRWRIDVYKQAWMHVGIVKCCPNIFPTWPQPPLTLQCPLRVTLESCSTDYDTSRIKTR